jgi:CMP-N-acetylneuraminic acid synthetase
MTPDVLTAIVPMRRDSKRVPGKNIRQIGGKPLYHHIIETLLQAESVGDVVVDTDSDELEEDLAHHFPTVRVLARPAPLADDMASAHEIVRNTVTQLEGDHFLQTHSTNPLLTPGTLNAAAHAYFAARPEHDSLFSVTPVHKRFYTTLVHPVNHDPLQIIRTQDLDPLLEENSCIYIFDRETIIRRRSRIGQHPLLFQMSPEESVDIDNELDLVIADAVYRAARSGASRA